MKPTFYTAYLMGGLGNQMFQISHALCQSLLHKVDCYFKDTAFTPMQANQPTKYKTNIFRNINFRDIELTPIRVNEPSWNDSKVIFDTSKNTEFYGYFQSKKNFLGFEKTISKIFEPTLEFLEKIKLIYPKIFESNSISIHVRRGDYLTIPKVLPTLDISYYNECLKNLTDTQNVYIFSDDKDWIKNNFDLSKYTSLTQHPTYAAIFGIISFTITLVAVALNIDDK
jgi:hypothetical protein